jgi:hypothetical protein
MSGVTEGLALFKFWALRFAGLVFGGLRGANWVDWVGEGV